MSATRKELIQKYAHVSARLVYRAALFSLCCRREFVRLTAQGLPPNEAAAQSIAKYCGLPASARAAPGALHTAGSASPTARDVPGTSQGAGGTGGEPPRTTTSPVSAPSSDPVVGAAAAVAGAGAGAGAGAAAVAAGGTDASEDADEPMTSDVGMPRSRYLAGFKRKSPKYKRNDLVRIKSERTQFYKGYRPTFNDEIFRIVEV